MKLIFAQGNPDKKYQNTRHNTGFLVLDALSKKYDATWRDIDKYKSRIAEVQINGEKVLLIKPLSYYNETGLVARTLLDYYKLESASDLVVIHDDLALPLGTVRVRSRGSDAGNNGIKSLNLHISEAYNRIRVGIWTEGRDRMDDVNFVLGVFPKQEKDTVNKHIIPHVIELIEQFVDGKLEVSSATMAD
jgi:PTH1 family peptidyl-tRNA hydrolase